jgi:hypothetical protein
MQKTDMIAEIARRLETAGLKVVPPFGPFRGWTELIIYSRLQTDTKTGEEMGGERGLLDRAKTNGASNRGKGYQGQVKMPLNIASLQ